MSIQPNLRRSSPLLYGVQQYYSILPIDGLYGPKTAKCIDEITESEILRNIKKISLEYRILEIIGCFEVGPSTKNPWRKLTKIDDGAGWNGGVFQANSLGSFAILKKMTGWQGDIQSMFNDMHGPQLVQVQVDYFNKYIFDKCIEFAREHGLMESDNQLLLLCDSLVQGGTLYPSRPPRTYDYWKLDNTLKKEVQLLYSQNTVKKAFSEAIKLHQHMYAELHPLSGNPKFIQDMLSRRRTASYGYGKVHGETYDLSLFGFEKF